DDTGVTPHPHTPLFRSAKYLSIRLNITNAPVNTVSASVLATSTNGHSGARPNTSDERNPSTTALSGLSTNNGRNFADTADSGYADRKSTRLNSSHEWIS